MNFYILSTKLSPQTIQAHAVSLSNNQDKNGLSDYHKLMKGYYDEIFLPVVFKIKYGKKFEDVLDTGWPSLYLISNKVVNLLEKSNLTGWKTFPVKLIDRDSNVVEGYKGISIIGKSDKVFYDKSNIVEKKLFTNGTINKYYKGLNIDLTKWDGSDFFIPASYFGIFVTQQTSEVLKKSKLTNIKLKNIKDIEIDEYTAEFLMVDLG